MNPKILRPIAAATLTVVVAQKLGAYAHDPQNKPILGNVPTPAITVVTSASTDTGTVTFPTDLVRSLMHIPRFALNATEQSDT